MGKILASTLPTIVLVVGVAVAIGMVMHWRRSLRHRRSPLTETLLRSPGESLRQQIDDLDSEAIFLMLFAAVTPLLFVSVHLSESYLGRIPESWPRLMLNAIGLFGMTGYCIYKLRKTLSDRENRRLGYDAERATGQELTRLIGLGFHVYHDVPAKGRNLDHVVVSNIGVFVIESKGRSKKSEKGGSAGATVYYNGKALQFPSWTETEPIEQVEAAAHWLSKELSRETGESIRAQPVLSIVGWKVERRDKKDGPLIYNGGNPHLLFPKWKRQDLSEGIIRTICNRLEEWVGDVEPSAYKKQQQQDR